MIPSKIGIELMRKIDCGKVSVIFSLNFFVVGFGSNLHGLSPRIRNFFDIFVKIRICKKKLLETYS